MVIIVMVTIVMVTIQTNIGMMTRIKGPVLVLHLRVTMITATATATATGTTTVAQIEIIQEMIMDIVVSTNIRTVV